LQIKIHIQIDTKMIKIYNIKTYIGSGGRPHCPADWKITPAKQQAGGSLISALNYIAAPFPRRRKKEN
jgi:hypothetical protein